MGYGDDADVIELMGSGLESWTSSSAGLAKALMKPSEPYVRVLAVLRPPLEVTRCRLARGVQRLYINMMYVLIDKAGEMHLPKGTNRREFPLTAAEDQALRAHVLDEAKKLSERRVPFSAACWRQMTNEEMAAAVESGGSAKLPRCKPLTAKSCEQSALWDAEEIVEERPSSGMAGRWFLVRWSGYHPTWEAWWAAGNVGGPVLTWEPLRNVSTSEAFSAWEEAQARCPWAVGRGRPSPPRRWR